MDIKPSTTIIASLKKGKLPDIQPWDLKAAIKEMADLLSVHNVSSNVGEIRAACEILNGHRQFDQTLILAQAWDACQKFDPSITRHHAQALINLGALDVAEKILRKGLAVISDPSADPVARSEIPEYEGLFGRIAKQRFVNTGSLEFLLEATNYYLGQYERQPEKRIWHGINVAALRAREQREGLQQNGAVTAEVLASTIYDQASKGYQENPSNPWLAATLSEASLALGKCDEAELWLYRFLNHPRVRPFDSDSYARQLSEIWGGGALDGGNTCADRLTRIITRHVVSTQKRWTVSAQDVSSTVTQITQNPKEFEKNFTGEYGFSLQTIQNMLTACASIGCVTNKAGVRLGTGFLVKASLLKQSLGDMPIFITNAHVISDTVLDAIPVGEALVTFEVESAAAGLPKFYKVDQVLFTSPPGDLGIIGPYSEALDVTIATLKDLDGSQVGLATASALPLIDRKTKAYVVGHPQGSGIQISLHDSMLLDYDDEERLVHYRTPTDPGNSGSAVFNESWQVIALHHGGSSSMPRLHGEGKYEANEGIALSAIRRKLND